jgi:PAS domain S-box-containing protein
MSDKDKAREELLKEVEILKKKLADYEKGNDSESDSAEMMKGLLSGIMQHGKFDLNGIQLEYLNVMINNIPNPAYVMDTTGKYIGCNEQYCNFIGLPANEINGKKLIDIFPDEIAVPEAVKDQELLQKGGIIDYERQLAEDDGTVWDLVFSKSVFKNFDGTIAGIICVINDISAKREAERALVESEQKLREANATKDKFFSIISHDLRSPFVSLLGMSELLVDDYDSMEDADRRTFIKDMHQSAKKAYDLMQNLLEWSNVQRGKLEFKREKMDINDIINEAVELEMHNAKQKGVEILMDSKPDINVFDDRNMIASSIRNLISNAIKYNKDNGEIKITTEGEEKFSTICVEDTGIGIEEHNLEKLFRIDVSHKSIGVSRTNKGTGLGLILCKEFVERNGGKITLKSEYGKGSKFCVRLPNQNA